MSLPQSQFQFESIVVLLLNEFIDPATHALHGINNYGHTQGYICISILVKVLD